MEQSADQTSAIQKMKNTNTPQSLYAEMINLVMNKHSPSEWRSLQTLFTWCTFAKERLSVYKVQQIWTLDPSLGDFDVLVEIRGISRR